jgi:hypothetical protein
MWYVVVVNDHGNAVVHVEIVYAHSEKVAVELAKKQWCEENRKFLRIEHVLQCGLTQPIPLG